MKAIAPDWYWAGVGAVAAIRTVWIASFCIGAAFTGWKRPFSLRRLRSKLGMATAERLRIQVGEIEDLDAEHQSFLQTMITQRTDAFTIGALGLAAWTVLEAAAPQTLPPFSLQMLFLGVTLSLIGPIVFRSFGTEGARLGLESTVAVGYAAIVLALCSLAPGVFGRERLDLAGFAVAVIVVIRELRETSAEIGRSWRLARGRTAEVGNENG